MVVTTLVLSAAACEPPRTALRVAPERLEPLPEALREQMRVDPYAFFRLINREFAQRVCRWKGGTFEGVPMVNLHGDAHLEQYAVTATSRGLMDFDDSSIGPASLDLVRFGVSIHLAARANGWEEDAQSLVESFVQGYSRALDDPSHEAPVPRIVARVRASFRSDRLYFLDGAEALMEPRSMTPDEVGVRYRLGLDLFAGAMLDQHPEMSPDFFAVKTTGELTMGIGSRLDEKFLFRVEGPSLADEDDLIFEAKLLKSLDGIDCVRRNDGDPNPILLGQSRLAYQPYDYVGFVVLDPARASDHPGNEDYFDGSVFWVHSWIDNYTELSAEGVLESVEEMREVVYDAGVQLGRGHPKSVAPPLDAELRRSLLRMAEVHADAYYEMVRELTGETLEAWELSMAAARR